MTTKVAVTTEARRQVIGRSVRNRGLSNLFRKEMAAWWSTRNWWVQMLIYLTLINGLTGAALFGLTQSGELASVETTEVYLLFFVFHLLFASAGVIITSQGAVVGEKQQGTAAWILSKPVSRSSFLLAKYAAFGVNFLIVTVLIPSAVVYGIWTWTGLAPSLAALPVMLGGLALSVLFYLSLTLMLGTLFNSRAAVAGTAFVVLFLMIQLGQQLTTLLPGGIPFLLAEIVQGNTVPSTLPFYISGASSVLFLLVALWRFERTEF